uniref:Zn-finger (CXXC)-4 isoform X2 n=1 Tax=Ciona intestinalis TaxID=7719 RepID=UPI000521B0B3|nr:Zn-finger (CXXC)-4 isoform X2 [Ciona intestinalis]|eukprot:XP_009862099.1 Zn-finger (CXXC)-4 isoform X2 [Ciona intestinalis]
MERKSEIFRNNQHLIEHKKDMFDNSVPKFSKKSNQGMEMRLRSKKNSTPSSAPKKRKAENFHLSLRSKSEPENTTSSKIPPVKRRKKVTSVKKKTPIKQIENNEKHHSAQPLNITLCKVSNTNDCYTVKRQDKSYASAPENTSEPTDFNSAVLFTKTESESDSLHITAGPSLNISSPQNKNTINLDKQVIPIPSQPPVAEETQALLNVNSNSEVNKKCIIEEKTDFSATCSDASQSTSPRNKNTNNLDKQVIPIPLTVPVCKPQLTEETKAPHDVNSKPEVNTECIIEEKTDFSAMCGNASQSTSPQNKSTINLERQVIPIPSTTAVCKPQLTEETQALNDVNSNSEVNKECIIEEKTDFSATCSDASQSTSPQNKNTINLDKQVIPIPSTVPVCKPQLTEETEALSDVNCDSEVNKECIIEEKTDFSAMCSDASQSTSPQNKNTINLERQVIPIPSTTAVCKPQLTEETQAPSDVNSNPGVNTECIIEEKTDFSAMCGNASQSTSPQNKTTINFEKQVTPSQLAEETKALHSCNPEVNKEGINKDKIDFSAKCSNASQSTSKRYSICYEQKKKKGCNDLLLDPFSHKQAKTFTIEKKTPTSKNAGTVDQVLFMNQLDLIKTSSTKRTRDLPKYKTKVKTPLREKLGFPPKNLFYYGTGKLPCPDLGEGWYFEQIVRQHGKSAGQYDVYYYSPQNVRIRSKARLAMLAPSSVSIEDFDFNAGKIVKQKEHLCKKEALITEKLFRSSKKVNISNMISPKDSKQDESSTLSNARKPGRKRKLFGIDKVLKKRRVISTVPSITDHSEPVKQADQHPMSAFEIFKADAMKSCSEIINSVEFPELLRLLAWKNLGDKKRQMYNKSEKERFTISPSQTKTTPKFIPSPSQVPRTFPPLVPSSKLQKNTPNRGLFRTIRCKTCEPCLRPNCGECYNCRDMRQFGGSGKKKQSCIQRKCLRPSKNMSKRYSFTQHATPLAMPAQEVNRHPIFPVDTTLQQIILPTQPSFSQCTTSTSPFKRPGEMISNNLNNPFLQNFVTHNNNMSMPPQTSNLNPSSCNITGGLMNSWNSANTTANFPCSSHQPPKTQILNNFSTVNKRKRTQLNPRRFLDINQVYINKTVIA